MLNSINFTRNRNKFSAVGRNNLVIIALLVIAEAILTVFLFTSIFPADVYAGIGQNVTVITTLQVGTVSPEILNVSFFDGSTPIDLVANATRTVYISVIARDFNNESDITNISVDFYDLVNSSYSLGLDNNNHYKNSSCFINYSYGDVYEVNATCAIDVWYYANNATWRAEAIATDVTSLTADKNATTTINPLLSLGLPPSIDYGLVNSTRVSPEKVANVTNFGNVMVNLTLYGYAVTPGDNLSMNCTLGAVKNISIFYEKFNLTASNTSTLTLSEMEALYVNLTSVNTTVKKFNLPQRFDDSAGGEAINSTYWRIYVPTGVAGNCSGNIIFGAIRTPGT